MIQAPITKKYDREINLFITEYMQYNIWGFKRNEINTNDLRASISWDKILEYEGLGYKVQFPYKNDSNYLFVVLDKMKADGAFIRMSITREYTCTIGYSGEVYSFLKEVTSKESLTNAMYYCIGQVLIKHKDQFK